MLKHMMVVAALAAFTSAACVNEDQGTGSAGSNDVGSQAQANTGDSSDYVRVTSGWGWRRWSLAGLHKIECIHVGVVSGKYYTASYQGWSNTSWCRDTSGYTSTGWKATCSGSGVGNHNTDHDTCTCTGGVSCQCDHWFAAAGAAHDASDTAHENCWYNWIGTCNSKDWQEHFVASSGNGYWEDGH